MDAETINKYLDYDENTGVFTNKVSRGRAKKGSVAGSKNRDGYLRTRIDYKEIFLHRAAWIICKGNLDGLQIDHKNGVKHDNRITNLRIADNSENNANKVIQRNNTSGFKGVSLHKKSGLWFCYCTKNGKRHSGGYHKTPELAAIAASKLRHHLHCEFTNHGIHFTEPAK